MFAFLTSFSFAVWGGDPVYPTINYIQDPDIVIDYRGPDFHEPTPNMLAHLKEVSNFMTLLLIVAYMCSSLKHF